MFEVNKNSIKIDRSFCLSLTGPGIFQEYLNEPELTTQRLKEINGVRYVRTGDLQKWDKNQNLVLVGRIDYQIKIRGQRLEPAEIENVIRHASSDIHECLVMKIEHDKQDYLVAYLASTVSDNEKTMLISRVEEVCYSLLPPIKRPSIYHILHENKLPRSPNGKILHRLLPQPMFTTRDLSIKTEHGIEQLWQQILPHGGIEKKISITLDTSWYQLGGNSLGLMKLLSEYHRNFIHGKCKLPNAQLLQHATIREHTKLLCETLEAYRKGNNHTPQLIELQRTKATKGICAL